jgi:DNA (cytosine-5)-methyltransferase 1
MVAVSENASLELVGGELPSPAVPFSVTSLFAGCGGLDLGFRGDFSVIGRSYRRLPFALRWANDFNPRACESYAENLGAHVRCGDIREILRNPSEYGMPPHSDVVTGGFPCQAFSLSGKRLGFDDPRGQLYLSMRETVDRLKPKVFVAENVKGLLSHDGGSAFRTIVGEFEELGYAVTWKLYKAMEYGVPQTRERVLVVGTRIGVLPAFEHPSSSPGIPLVSAKEALGDLEDVPWDGVPNHRWAKCKKTNGQGNGTIRADAPAPTMRAEHHGNIEFHYSLGRRLSAREAARIQTFPDDFVLRRSATDAYRQVGNAVPPVLAWHLARALAAFLVSNGHSGTPCDVESFRS